MNEYNHKHSYEEGSKVKSRNVTFKNILERLLFQHNIILHHHS
jgi:hypothetical protein